MYYFLDIDGVLNKKSDWVTPFTLNNECVNNFLELIKKDENPHIILSSSWRLGITNLNECAKNDPVSKIKRKGIKIEDVTPSSSRKTRQEEIEYYIKRHNITDYVIIDDDNHLFPYPERINLYLVDMEKGITKEDVKVLARKINKKRFFIF